MLAEPEFAQVRVVVELTGWAYHRTLEDLRADAARENALAVAGSTVLQFTWWDVVRRPEQCLARIGEASARVPVAA